MKHGARVVPPIIVSEGGDLSFDASLEEAARSLEAPDVLEGLYKAFDATGKILEITTEGGPRDFSAPVHITASSEIPRPDELRDLLLSWLAHFHVEAPSRMSTRSLVMMAAERAGYQGPFR